MLSELELRKIQNYPPLSPPEHQLGRRVAQNLHYGKRDLELFGLVNAAQSPCSFPVDLSTSLFSVRRADLLERSVLQSPLGLAPVGCHPTLHLADSLILPAFDQQHLAESKFPWVAGAL